MLKLISLISLVAMLFAPLTIRAQTDTVPVLLQQKILGRSFRSGGVGQIDYLEYAPPGWVFATNQPPFYVSGNLYFWGNLFTSSDNGASFRCTDTSGYEYILSKSTSVLYRITHSGLLQWSYDQGLVWGIPLEVDTIRVSGKMSVSPDGKRIAIAENLSYNSDAVGYPAAISSSNKGYTWDYHWWSDTGFHDVYGGGEDYYPIIQWADQQNGLILTPRSIIGDSAYMIVTSDGGLTWRHVIGYRDPMELYLWDDQYFNIEYPFPSTIIFQDEFNTATSFDTGKTWRFLPTGSPAGNNQIDYITPNRWIAGASYGFRDNGYWGLNRGSYPVPLISSDSGMTWKKVNYAGPRAIVLTSFKDSLNGIGCDGYEIVARTSDGGYTWQTVDSSDYMFGTITPALGRDSAYYAFSPLHDTTYGNGAYAFFTRDRGATWEQVQTNMVGYAFAGLDSEFWVGGTGFARIASLYGILGTTIMFSKRDSTRITAIDKNFVWVSNADELHAASNNGMIVSWGGNMAVGIPGYTATATYRFFAINRNVVYVRAPDTIYVTRDGGGNWSVAPAMPDKAVDAKHWFIFTSDTMSLRYTTDGGQSFTTVSIPNTNGRTILPIDSENWFVDGLYTTNGGSSWQRIPGWDNKLGLYPVDSTTAFGEPFADNLSSVQVLWRLQLPFTSSPLQGVVATMPDILLNPSASPNPVSTGTIISFGISKEAYVKIEVFDILGNRVSSAGFESLFEPGNKAVPLSLQGLPAGIYFARIVTAYGEVQTVKLVKE